MPTMKKLDKEGTISKHEFCIMVIVHLFTTLKMEKKSLSYVGAKLVKHYDSSSVYIYPKKESLTYLSA